MTIQACDLGSLAERSRVLLSLGGEADITRRDDGRLTTVSPVYYVQPNDDLVPGLTRGMMIRRLVIFPRRGPLMSIPIEAVGQDVLDSFPDGPPILADQDIPLSAAFLTPLRALLFAGLAGGLVLVGLAIAEHREKRALAALRQR